ncbi:hypothetical protein [Streptomyces sp. MA5143a]|uniref:hypothetical protein n=1 Tax=Streptomyces sp. MA5143a TaxID=2083010 RepID=UPI000D2DD1B4|nr:hypothetical protein [Streptomyces sp. MA5143a]SPF06410.1 hypothetical protein SMA5143A_7239 [Streptomyces sp. MA5143a]
MTLVPSRAEQLDATSQETLDAIPDGPAEERGVAAGEKQAGMVLKPREGDGLDPASVNAPYPGKPAAPGMWQPTPPAYAPAARPIARVHSGIHTRSADEAGVSLGKNVARCVLRNTGRLLAPR